MASIWDDYEKAPTAGDGSSMWADFDSKQPGEFRKGVSAGVDQLQGMAGGAVGLIGSAVGSDAVRDWGLDVYQRNEAEAAQNPPKVPDVTEIASLGQAKDWLVYQVGNQLPILAATFGAGGAGGLIGRKVAEKGLEAGVKAAALSAMEKRAAALAAEGMAEPLAARTAAKEVADDIIAKGMNAGALAGAGAASFGMEAGSIYPDIQEKTGQDRPGVAAAFAVPAALLDVLPIGMAFNKLGIGQAAREGVQKVLEREGWAKAIGKQAAAEGVTEGLQTIVERAAVQWVDENHKVFTPEGWNEIINAAAAGTALGGMTGAGAKALEGSARTDSRKELLDRLRAAQADATTHNREQATADAVTKIGQAGSVEEAIQHAMAATGSTRSARAELTLEPFFESDVGQSSAQGLIGGELDQAISSAERAAREQPAYDQLAQAKDADLGAMVDQRRDIDADAAIAESERLAREQETADASRPPPSSAMRDAMGKALLGRMEALERQKPAAPAPSIDEAAHDAAASPQNERAEPTDGQKDAGNYKKGQVRLSGLAISVENPEGSTRSGVGPDGKPWSNKLQDHYGYIKGVPARAPDKEHVDVFIKPGTQENFAGDVFVVDQNNERGRFDEPKVMIGYASPTEAREGYLRNYAPGWKGLRNITQMPMGAFKEALLDPDSFKKPQPFTPQYYVDERTLVRRVQPGMRAPEGEQVFTDLQLVNKERRRRFFARRQGDPDKDSLNAWIAKVGGLDIAERMDTIGDEQNQAFNGSQWLFTTKGEKIDELARRAYEDGYLSEQEYNDVDGGVEAFRRKIADEFNGLRKHFSNNSTGHVDEEFERHKNEIFKQAHDFGIPTEGLAFDDVVKAVRQREETEAALQETEADKEARLEREAIQADNLVPEEDYGNVELPEDGQQGAGPGEDPAGERDADSVAQPKPPYRAEVEARPGELARGDQAPRGERRQADEGGALKLETQTAADLAAKEKQATKGDVESKAPRTGTESEPLLTPPAGTAPARDVADQKVPTQQGKLFEPGAPIYDLDQDGPRLVGDDVAIVQPSKWESRGDLTYYEHLILDLKAKKVVGNLTLGWRGDKVGQLLNIRIFGGNQTKGLGEATVRAILEQNGDAELHVAFIAPSAEGFWRKMGVRFVPTDEGNDGIASVQTYRAARPGEAGADAQPQGAAEPQAGRAGEGGRPGGEAQGPGAVARAEEVSADDRERARDERVEASAEQLDLFSATAVPGSPAKALEKIVVEPARKGTLKVGYEIIDTPEKAAHVFAAMRKAPREYFQMLGLDANDRPVAFFDLFRGTVSETSVYPREVWTALYQTPGVRKVWVAHNHPSGVAQPSGADERLTQQLKRGLSKDIGVELMGHVIIAGTRAVEFMHGGHSFDVPAAVRKFEIPILERVVRKAEKPDIEITSPASAREAVRTLKLEETGLIFMDHQHRVTGWWPMSLEEMKKLRTGDLRTGAAKLFRAIGRNNANAVMLYAKEKDRSAVEESGKNLASALTAIQVKLLDVFMPDPVHDRLISLQERGTDLQTGSGDRPFYRRGETAPGPGARAVRAELAGAFGEKGIKALEDAGTLELTTSADPRLAPIRERMSGAEDSVYWRGKAWLLTDRIVPGQAPNRLLHELGEHHGLEAMLGDAAYKRLLSRVETMYKGGNAAVREAWALVKQNYGEEAVGSPEFLKEVIAALTEDARVSKQAWWQELLDAIRAWLTKQGLTVKDEKDVLTLLRASLRKVMDDAGEPKVASRAQPAFSRAAPAPLWYSSLERQVGELKQGSAPAAQWKGTLKAMQGVSKDELEWSGVNEWLDMQPGKVTKEQLLDYLAQNGVKVEEAVLGGAETEQEEPTSEMDRLIVELTAKGYQVDQAEPDLAGDYTIPSLLRDTRTGKLYDILSHPGEEQAKYGLKDLPDDVRPLVEQLNAAADAHDERTRSPDGTRYGEYTLPGGKNYRELLLTLPVKRVYPKMPEYEDWLKSQDWFKSGAGEDGPKARELYAQWKVREAEGHDDASFRSSHFDAKNIVAHVRFNERTDAEGKKVLFLEEIQSDWAQKGKRDGFGDKQAWRIVSNADGKSWGTYPSEAAAEAARRNIKDDVRIEQTAEKYSGVPVAPFVGKTEAWVGLSLKRMIRWAAENGFDRVAWTTGKQQTDRYNLRHQVDKVKAFRRDDGSYDFMVTPKGQRGHRDINAVREEKLADTVGKELAKKISEQPEGWHTYEGVDLEIGGEGMLAFYDNIVPNIANSLLKKIGGGRVGKVDLREPRFKVVGSGRDWAYEDEGGAGEGGFTSRAAAQAAADEDNANDTSMPVEQPGFDITPEMRSFANRGLPMFSRPSAIAGSRTVGDYRDGLGASSSSFVRDLLHSDSTFNWWHKSIGTQQHKALSNGEFKQVYDEGQAFLADVSKYANEAADQATSLLPRIEGFADFKKSTPSGADIEGATQALYAGTLWGGGSPMEGRVWSDEELRTGKAITGNVRLQAFKPLSDSQVALYRQALASIGASLESLGKSLIHRLARAHDIGFDRGMSLEDVAKTVRDAADDMIEAREEQLQTMKDPQYIGLAEDRAAEGVPGTRAAERARKEARRAIEREMDKVEREIAELEQLNKGVTDIETKARRLIDRGYFPAMRFGSFAVHVVRDVKGQKTPEQLYFGLFESQTKANLAARELAREFPDGRIERGIISKEQHRLFQGMSLDALETFADYITGEDGAPLAKNPLVQGFLKAAVAERSSLKRHIHRKGIAGYSDDLPRVLASFTVSSARTTSSNYHMAQMHKLAGDIKAGDVKDEAIKLVTYLRDPQEEAQALRGFLFAQFLGGSIAHGLVNMTQPFMVTIPYLSQHTSAADAAAKVVAATTARPEKLTGRIRDAFERAKKEGVVAPQEIHQLRAETGGLPIAKNLALRKLSFLWGSIYAVTEQFNRASAFIAAYRIAEEKGMADPYTFAANTVNETQFVYNKGNRPNWARGAFGATVFTFKQFSISYLELGKRLFAKDRKAFALMALMLLGGAGVQGLPFAEDLEDLIDTIGQWMGFATNSKKALRKWATEQLGPEMAQVVLHGISGFSWMPVDVSNRLGLQNLIPGTGMLKLSEQNKARDVLELVGPIGQFVPTEDTMLGKALERLSKGDYFGAVKAGAPVAVQNVAKGAEMLDTGEARDAKGKKIMPVTPGEAVLKMAGLQPASVARASERVSQVMQDVNLQKRMESEIAEQWARGLVDGRPGEITAAVNKLMEWNRDNPELRIKVTAEQIRSRVKAMRTSRDERLTKSAPPEIRATVRDELRQ